MAEFFNEGDEPNGGQVSQSEGGQLRAQLEKALEANRKMQAKLTTYEVQEFLGGKQLDLVKPEELAGVDPQKWEETATKIQTERTEMQQALLRKALAGQGFDEDQIEGIVTGTVANTAQVVEAAATSRARTVGRIAAPPPPPVNTEKLHGLEAIKAGLK